VDVTVCDGFAGNVVLKVVEGTAQELMADVKAAVMRGWSSRLAGLLLRPASRCPEQTVSSIVAAQR